MAEEKRTQQQCELKQMSTEALEAIICADAEHPGMYEAFYIDAVLDELVCRNTRNGKTKSKEELQGLWAKIAGDVQQKKDRETVEKIEAWAMSDSKRTGSRAGRMWLRVSAAAAVLAFVILFVPVAEGTTSLFDVLVNWTEEVFSISIQGNPPAVTEPLDNPEYEDSNEGLAMLREKLREYGVTERVVPTWIPERFGFVSLKCYTTNDGEYIGAYFENNEGSLILMYRIRDKETPFTGEKDEYDTSVLTINGITHYISSDLSEIRCAWVNGRTENLITGEVSDQEMVSIVNSIYNK